MPVSKHIPLLAALLPLLALVACKGAPSGIEGDDAMDCSDGLDNDDDGLTDCNDDGCEGATSCLPPTGDDTSGGDTSGGGDSGGDCTRLATALDQVTYDCDSIGYFFDALLIGWGSSPELYILETASGSSYSEMHPFPSNPYEYDPNGCSELYYLEIDTVGSIGEVVEGETTLLSCDQINALSWLIYIFDTSGNAVECAGWGDDVAEINKFYGAACPTI
jgi:hypothetical protein